MTNEHLDLDDVVAVSAIVAAILDRPLTPFESSRLKTAFHRSRSLVELASALAAQIPSTPVGKILQNDR